MQLYAIVLLFVSVMAVVAWSITNGAARQDAAARKTLMTALSLATFLAIGGIVWEHLALLKFGMDARTDARGLIMNPIPNTVNHVYTQNGRFYERWAFQIPIAVVSVVLIAVAIVSSIPHYRRGRRRWAAAVWVWVLTMEGALIVVTIAKWVVAVNLFI